MMMHSNLSPKKFLIPIVIFILLLLGAFFFRGSAVYVSDSIAHPLWQIASVSSLSDFFAAFEMKENLVKENEELQREVSQLQVFKLDHDRLLNENNQLKEALGRSNGRDLLLAGILSKPPISAYDTFVVDAGSSEGVKMGDEVYVAGNVGVGKVFEISADTAKVRLYSSPNTEMNVFLGQDQVPVTVTGMGAGNFKTSVPRGVTVPLNSKVYFPGISGDLLGVVQHVEQRENDTFQEVYISSPVNIWSLNFVEIAK